MILSSDKIVSFSTTFCPRPTSTLSPSFPTYTINWHMYPFKESALTQTFKSPFSPVSWACTVWVRTDLWMGSLPHQLRCACEGYNYAGIFLTPCWLWPSLSKFCHSLNDCGAEFLNCPRNGDIARFQRIDLWGCGQQLVQNDMLGHSVSNRAKLAACWFPWGS